MRPALILAATAALALAAPKKGLPARSSPSVYPGSGSERGISVAAEAMDPDQIRGSFSTDLSSYIVVEVAIYPKPGTPVEISGMDFALFIDGRMVRPVEP